MFTIFIFYILTYFYIKTILKVKMKDKKKKKKKEKKVAKVKKVGFNFISVFRKNFLLSELYINKRGKFDIFY